MDNKTNESKIREATILVNQLIDIIADDIFDGTDLIFFPLAIDTVTGKPYPLLSGDRVKKVFKPAA